ncbi:hypothetical protein MKX47_15760 [Solibacillus sp. FSL R7-0668]|uniref:hypothetical protein n=1 Tax=Solibacillus sp. FSL R7-0668 TaxID=2921688 RepID=UPI0030F6FD96
MTDNQNLLMKLTGYNEDMHLMNCIWETGYQMEQLKKGYYQRYFPKDLKRGWGFNCYHCNKRVHSDKDESYYAVSMVWSEESLMPKRFCSKDCSDVFYNESMEWLLKEREKIENKRMQLRKASK